jgi:hypothetical protein
MAEIEQRPLDPRSDLAGYEHVGSRNGPFQLWIGGAPVITDAAVALVDFQKYELAALVTTGADTGKLARFVPGTHTAQQAVLTAQPVVAGQSTPYWNAGKFNHEAVVWPAGVALDTYLERKAFLTGTMLQVGHLI